MTRLFVAFPLPGDQREHLLRALRPIKDHDHSLRWTDPDQWHITLGFFGESNIDVLAEHTAQAVLGHGPIELELRGAGSFARRNLWLGVGGQTDRLKSLMAACDPEDDRRRAHLTVARTGRETSPLLADYVRALAVYSGPAWTADHVTLYASELGKGRSGGPLHSVVETFKLL